MLKRLSQKYRFYLLITGSFLFLIIAWKLALTRTFTLKKQCNNIEQQLIAIENAPQQIADYQVRLKMIESRIGSNISSDKNINQLLLEKVSHYCKTNYIKFYELPQAHTIINNEYIIETNKVVLEGSFIKLLKLFYQLEIEKRYGKIISANFESVKNLKTNRIQLYLTVYLQNIRKQEPNEKSS